MITLDMLRQIILALPTTEETTSWDAVSFKVNGKAMLFWNPTHDCPVFKVPFEERDHLIEMDPDAFHFTDHYRDYPIVLARIAHVDPVWLKAALWKRWRKVAPKRLAKAHDAA